MKSINFILVVVLFFTQSTMVRAGTVEDEFNLQLLAIARYLERQLPVSSEPLSTDEMKDIILDGADWIVSAQEENGHFGYEYLPYEDEYVNDDNMVRQGGTLYALSEVYKKQTLRDPEKAAAIEKAISYFASISGASTNDKGNFLCIKNSEASVRCDLGSTALVLLGILNYVAVEPDRDTDYKDIIEKYSNYLMAAKFPDRGFSNTYNTNSGFSEEESPFYNGEAMLALVRYYQYEKNDEVKTILQDVFSYLRDKEEFETPLYLWIMAALKDMQYLWPNDEYVTYTKEFTNFRLQNLQYRRDVTHNYCAPVEGLASAYSVLVGHEPDVYLSRLNNELGFWLNKTKRLQLNESDIYRVVKNGNELSIKELPNPDLALGGFLTGEDELTQRIDFTQHCVNTYLQKLTDIDGKSL